MLRAALGGLPRSRSGREWLRAWRRRGGSKTPPAASAGRDARSPKLARLEAALFVANVPLSPRKLSQFAALSTVTEVRRLIEQLNASYDASGSAFRVERVAAGFQLLSRPQFAPWLDRLHHRQTQLKLSPPLQETLAIVAYRQPVTRADVEAVRGVQSAEILKQLMERGLVKIVGEDDSLGRPYLYGTTRTFLERFGLTNLDQLPMAETLRKPASTTNVPAAEEEPAEAAPDTGATAGDEDAEVDESDIDTLAA